MERLNWHVARELSRYAEVHVIGPAGSASLAPKGVDIDEVGSARIGPYLLRAFVKGLSIARRWRPDVVLAGSGLTAPMAVIAARLSGGRSAVYAHGLDLTVDNAIYRRLWLPMIARAERVIVNSSATRLLALGAGIDGDRIRIVHPGVSPPAIVQFGAESPSSTDFRHRYGLVGRKILISVGRLTRRKGILEFVRDILPAIAARHSTICLLIVGDAPVNALAASTQSVESIEAVARSAGVLSNLHFLGKISDSELEAVYANADLHVFPVQQIANDPEGFGMVAIEAAAHGVATVAYGTGGVPDAVLDGRSGRLVAVGNTAGFIEATLKLLDSPLPPDEIRAFARLFFWETIGAELAQSLELPIDSRVI